LIVTAAMATAAATAVRALRIPLLGYVVVVAITRLTFGAHFPLDVVVGAALGYELGLFTARLMAGARLLPAQAAQATAAPLAVSPEVVPSAKAR
jgi:membrane-associated phospholipid phosphatase